MAWRRPNAGGIGGSTGTVGASLTRRSKAAPFTVASDDCVLDVTSVGTVTLPTPTDGRVLYLKRLIGVAGDVVLDGGAAGIDGSLTLTLGAEGSSVTLIGNRRRCDPGSVVSRRHHHRLRRHRLAHPVVRWRVRPVG